MSKLSPFITKDTAPDAFDESVKWFRPYFEPLDEFERIARNRPSDKISPELPRVTDGTMAAIIQENPKRVIQQVATGRVGCGDYKDYAAIADMVYVKKLIPSYNRMGSALQKQWNMLSKSMTYGRATSYTFLTSTNNEMHTDFIIPYAKDVLTEKGKVYAPDSNISFMRSWYQKRDLQAIINKEKALMSKFKDYTSDWDLKELAKFMEQGGSAKPADQQTPAEREKGGDNGGFEVIHAFQTGVGAEMYSFSPRHENGKCLRVKINKDPRGNIPLDHLYCNIDLSNPMGRGQIELSGGVQNLIDQQMQMFQFMTTLEMGPPLQVWGTPNKKSIKMRPNAIWDMGASQINKVEPYVVNNNAISNFGTNYGLLKSQILNLNSSQDHSISAESGSPAQSKTQAGVQAAESRLGVSDNYLRKQFETWWGNQSETSININFAENITDQKLKLEGEDLKEVLKGEAAKYVDPKTGILTIPYKKISDVAFQFEVDASSSEIKVDADNVEKLTKVYEIMQADPDPSLADKKQKLLKVLIDEIGAEGTDDLFPEEGIGPDGQPIQQQPAGPDPNMIMQMVQQAVQEAMAQKPQDDPLLKIFKDLPESAKKALLEKYQMPSADPSPVERKLDIEAHDSVARADQAMQSHEQTVKQADVTNRQAEQAMQSEKKGTEAPEDDMGAQGLDDQEQQFVQHLFQRGFNEQDVEQAVVMVRQGRDPGEVIQTIGAKYAQTGR